MSNIKNSGLDQYGVGPFEQQQFGTAGVEGVNSDMFVCCCCITKYVRCVFRVLGKTDFSG